MRFLLTISLLAWLCLAQAGGMRVILLSTPLAGSQYYALDSAWNELHVGDRLTLHREPDNRHDRNAVRVEWRGRQLGYLPRVHNRVIAGALDEGERIGARIIILRAHPDPWQRVVLEIYVDV
jgi:hypothetical protein